MTDEEFQAILTWATYEYHTSPQEHERLMRLVEHTRLLRDALHDTVEKRDMGICPCHPTWSTAKRAWMHMPSCSLFRARGLLTEVTYGTASAEDHMHDLYAVPSTFVPSWASDDSDD